MLGRNKSHLLNSPLCSEVAPRLRCGPRSRFIMQDKSVAVHIMFGRAQLTGFEILKALVNFTIVWFSEEGSLISKDI